MRKVLALMLVMAMVLSTGAPLSADEGTSVMEDRLMKLEALVTQLQAGNGDAEAVGALEAKVETLQNQVSALSKENSSLQKEVAATSMSVDQKLKSVQVTKSGDTVVMPYVPSFLEGIEIGFAATAVIAGNADGAGSDTVDSAYTTNLTMTKTFEDGGIGYLNIEQGEGSGLDQRFSSFSNQNYDAGTTSNTFTIAELYYQRQFLDDALTMRFGKIDTALLFDGNNVAGNETTQFLHSSFVHDSTIPFLRYALGISADYSVEAIEGLSFQSGIFNSDADFTDLGTGAFLYLQGTYETDIVLCRPGTLRMYMWYDTDRHTEMDGQGAIAATEDNAKFDDYGVGINFDQELTDNIAMFGRVGWAKADMADKASTTATLMTDNEVVNLAWSAGVQFDGAMWNREDDMVGIAIGQNRGGDDYAGSVAGNQDNAETIAELYYNYAATDYLALTPFAQAIISPRGVAHRYTSADSKDTIVIFGVRAQLDF